MEANCLYIVTTSQKQLIAVKPGNFHGTTFLYSSPEASVNENIFQKNFSFFFNDTKVEVGETKNNSHMYVSHLYTAEGAEYEQLWKLIKYFLSVLLQSHTNCSIFWKQHRNGERQNMPARCGCGDWMCSLLKCI